MENCNRCNNSGIVYVANGEDDFDSEFCTCAEGERARSNTPLLRRMGVVAQACLKSEIAHAVENGADFTISPLHGFMTSPTQPSEFMTF